LDLDSLDKHPLLYAPGDDGDLAQWSLVTDV